MQHDSSPTRPTEILALLAVHADAAELYARQLGESWVPGYLASRSLDACLGPGSPWTVGYAPHSWTWLTDQLRAFGYSDTVLERSGLALRTRSGSIVDRFRDRLTLGIRDVDGDLVGFTCRAAPNRDPSCPKYLNSPTTDVYRKSEALFGLGEAAVHDASDRVPVLVEGPLDAMAVGSADLGRYVPLAVCGTAFSTVHANLVTELSTTGEVVVGLDDDGAGHRAAAHALEVLRSVGIEPMALDLGVAADDPASLLQRLGPAALASGLSSPKKLLADKVVEDVIRDAGDRLRWVEGQVLTARAVMPIVARCSPVQAARLANKVARLCHLAPETVANELHAELERSCASEQRSGCNSRTSGIAVHTSSR